jgi:hypothetical protein
MLQQANRQFRAGGLTTGNNEVLVETGAFLKTAEEVGNVVIGVFSGRRPRVSAAKSPMCFIADKLRWRGADASTSCHGSATARKPPESDCPP